MDGNMFCGGPRNAQLTQNDENTLTNLVQSF